MISFFAVFLKLRQMYTQPEDLFGLLLAPKSNAELCSIICYKLLIISLLLIAMYIERGKYFTLIRAQYAYNIIECFVVYRFSFAHYLIIYFVSIRYFVVNDCFLDVQHIPKK